MFEVNKKHFIKWRIKFMNFSKWLENSQNFSEYGECPEKSDSNVSFSKLECYRGQIQVGGAFGWEPF